RVLAAAGGPGRGVQADRRRGGERPAPRHRRRRLRVGRNRRSDAGTGGSAGAGTDGGRGARRRGGVAVESAARVGPRICPLPDRPGPRTGGIPSPRLPDSLRTAYSVLHERVTAMDQRPNSDRLFFLALALLGGSYVALIVALLAADVAFTTPGHLLAA